MAPAEPHMQKQLTFIPWLLNEVDDISYREYLFGIVSCLPSECSKQCGNLQSLTYSQLLLRMLM